MEGQRQAQILETMTKIGGSSSTNWILPMEVAGVARSIAELLRGLSATGGGEGGSGSP